MSRKHPQVQDIYRAVDDGDIGRAESLIEQLLPTATTSGNLEAMGQLSFALGVVRDCQGRLAEAEAAFSETLLYDEQVHGPDHPAVADALRSLAMVQNRREGRSELAAQSLKRAITIYQEHNLQHAAEAGIKLAELTWRGGDRQAAVEHFREAETQALMSAGAHSFEALRASNRRLACEWELLTESGGSDFRPTFVGYMRLTRRWKADMERAAELEVAWAWLQLGCLSQAFRAFVEASFAWTVASKLGGPARAEARSRLERSTESHAFAPFQCWRLTHYNAETAGGHVAHPKHGVYPFTGAKPAEVGDEVSVELAGAEVSVSSKD